MDAVVVGSKVEPVCGVAGNASGERASVME